MEGQHDVGAPWQGNVVLVLLYTHRWEHLRLFEDSGPTCYRLNGANHRPNCVVRHVLLWLKTGTFDLFSFFAATI